MTYNRIGHSQGLYRCAVRQNTEKDGKKKMTSRPGFEVVILEYGWFKTL